ncbi:MAG: NrdH-redoxin [Nanoarchaeota archaeon]|jgi:glutaredoxin-like YruB-family protein|nr:NrdH-redoxin [Nanoarchaeota archaeon]|tara:strand:+ start:6989 stop:7234 length:246 start_codon:yes stop_codon:yes gene_type:complete
MKVKVYTSTTCGYCNVLKDFLKKHKIEFEEIDVNKDETATKEMVEKTGTRGVPVTVIDNNFDKAIIGFDEAKLKGQLKLNE